MNRTVQKRAKAESRTNDPERTMADILAELGAAKTLTIAEPLKRLNGLKAGLSVVDATVSLVIFGLFAGSSHLRMSIIGWRSIATTRARVWVSF